MSERSEESSLVTKPLVDFTELAFRRGWFKAGGGCMLAKRGSEGGFVATPAFIRSSPGEDLQSRLICLNRYGHSELSSNRSSCSGTNRSIDSSGATTPCSGSSRNPSMTLRTAPEVSSPSAGRESRGSRHAYVYCQSEGADSSVNVPMRGQLSQQEFQGDTSKVENSSASLLHLQLSGSGWSEPIRLQKPISCSADFQNEEHSMRDSDACRGQQHTAQLRPPSVAVMQRRPGDWTPRQAARKPRGEESSSTTSTTQRTKRSAGLTLRLSGDGWRMPIKVDDAVAKGVQLSTQLLHEDSVRLHEQRLHRRAPAERQQQQPAGSDTASSPALSPRERIHQLEKACSRASTPLPVLAPPPRLSYGRCPLTRLPPCISKTGAVPNQARGPVAALERTDAAELCDAHISPGKGKLEQADLPTLPISDSSVSSCSEEQHSGLIAAGRDRGDSACKDVNNEAAHTEGSATDGSATDVETDPQQGASSLEGRRPAKSSATDRRISEAGSIDSEGRQCAACSRRDLEEGREPKDEHVVQICDKSLSGASQHSSSLYRTLWCTFSSVSAASGVNAQVDQQIDTRESNPLYACSISSNGIKEFQGARENAYYAASTSSSASSDYMLPQRQLFWPHAAQHSAAVGADTASCTAQSIPEDYASKEDAQLPSKPHELLPLLLVALKLKGDHCNVAVLNSSSACLALSQTLPAGADEIIAADSHVTRILNAHIGLPDVAGKLRTIVPVITLAEFPDAVAAADHVKAVMLAYPRTNAIVIREAGILCWGLITNAQAVVELYEYLLKCSCDMAQEAPPPRKSRVLGIRRTDTANEELYVERSCGNSSSGCNSQHTPASEHGHDVEDGLKDLLDGEDAPRPVRWNQPLMVIIACGIIVGILGTGVCFAIRDALQDGSWWKVAARLATLPMIGALALFGTIAIVCCIIISLGPIAHVEQNSKTYSAIKPPRWQGKLPRVTVQMPVYLEGFDFVIKPSIRSLQAAIAAYQAAGGSASIYVNEDGLQLLSEDEREERLEFYRQNDIGFVARPPHGLGGYVRAGRFKKASNMNYCLEVSRQMEIIMQEEGLDQYEALQEVRLRTLAQTPEQAFLAGGDVRIGDFILLVDSDTRVPEHCMLPTVTELMLSPKVAFTQHFTTPLQVSHDYFENAMAFFTRTIYNAIMLSVSGGDISPLVGHNAFLRWAAMKECAFQGENDGQTKYWSDAHVSEDFDIAIRFQVKGYIGRYITYTGPDFKEGLSLSIHDEISRMGKYAFGCSELVFNPLSQWFCRGPISALFRRYLWNSCTPLTNKLTIVAYICIYIALAIAWPVAVATYFLNSKCAWYAKTFEGTFEISMTCLVVFSVLTPIGNTVMMYRLGVTTLLRGAWLNVKYVLVFFFFFNGLSFHLSAAFASHLLGFKMSWGSTTKEVKDTNFFKELHATLTNYRSMYILFSLLAIMIVVMTGVMPHTVPLHWQINDPVFIVPLSFLVGGHLLAPLVLNPSIMRIKF